MTKAADGRARDRSRLAAKARKLMADLERYGTFGYVTRVEDYEADDRKVLRGIDSLYDLARKYGLAEDLELQQTRLQLRAEFSTARERARVARSQALAGAAERSAGASAVARDPLFRQYLEEMKIGEARRRHRR